MKNTVLFIGIMAGISVCFFILYIAALQYKKNTRRIRTIDSKDWLFHEFYKKVYGALWGHEDPDEIGIKLGIEVEKYYESCKITGTEPNVTKLIVSHIYGIALFTLFLFMGLFFNFVFVVFGAGAFVFFMFYEQKKLDKKAEAMRMQIANELPRFLDLLIPALQVGMSPDVAIYTLCGKLDTLLSREFLNALQETRLGISGWHQAMERVATKYRVETLDDFVMDITTAHKKGVSITSVVERKAADTRKTHVLTVKENATKTTNTILLPIIIFQFIPMIAYIMFPLIMQALTGFI